MGVSEVGALTRQFCVTENRTREINGDKRVWRLIGGDKTRFYCIYNEYFFALDMGESLLYA